MSADNGNELKPLIDLSRHFSTSSRSLKSQSAAATNASEERKLVLSAIDLLQQQTDQCEKDLADRLGSLKHHVLQMAEENRQAEWLPERYRHSISAGTAARSPSHGPISSVDHPGSPARGSLGGMAATYSPPATSPASHPAGSPLVLPATPNLAGTPHSTPFAHSMRPFASVGPQTSGAIDGEVKAFLRHYVSWSGADGTTGGDDGSAMTSPIPKTEQQTPEPPMPSLLRDTVDDFVLQKLLSDGITLDEDMMDDFGLDEAARRTLAIDPLRGVKEEIRRGVYVGRPTATEASGVPPLAADWWEGLPAEEMCETLLCHSFPLTHAWLRTLTAPPRSPSPALPAANVSGGSYEYDGAIDDAAHAAATAGTSTGGEALDMTASAPVIIGTTEASFYTYSEGTEDATETVQTQRQTTQESAEAEQMAGTHPSESTAEEAAEGSVVTSIESAAFSTPSAGGAYHTLTEGGAEDSLAEYSLEGIEVIPPPGNTRATMNESRAVYNKLNPVPQAVGTGQIPKQAQYEVNPLEILRCRVALFESDLIFLCVLQELSFSLEAARQNKKDHEYLVTRTFSFLEKLQQDPAYDRYHRFLSGQATELALLSHRAVLTAAGYMPMLLPSPSMSTADGGNGGTNDTELERFVLTVAPMLELWHGKGDTSTSVPSYAPLKRGVVPQSPRKGPTNEAAAPVLSPEVAPFVFLETVSTGLMDAVSGLAEAASLLRGTKGPDKDDVDDVETVKQFCQREGAPLRPSALPLASCKDYISKFVYPLSQPIIQELEALQSRGLLPMDDLTSSSDEDQPATPPSDEEGRTSPLKRHFSLPPSALDHLAEEAMEEEENDDEGERARSPPVESRSLQAQAARALFAALFDMGSRSPPKKLALPPTNARSAATLEIAHVSEVLTSLQQEKDQMRQVTSQCLRSACEPSPMFHSTMCYCPVSRRRCYDPLVSGAVTIMDSEEVLKRMRATTPTDHPDDAFVQYYNQFVDPTPLSRSDSKRRPSDEPQRVHYVSAMTTAGTLLRGAREEGAKSGSSADAASSYRATTNLLPVPDAERMERLNPPQFLQCGHVISDRTLQGLLSVPRRSRLPDHFNTVSCPYCAVETPFAFVKTISTLY